MMEKVGKLRRSAFLFAWSYLVGVPQQEPTNFGALATPIDHRLKIPIQMRPAKLPSLDPSVAPEPVADDHLPAVGAEQALGDLGPPGGGNSEDRHQVRHGDPEPRLVPALLPP